MTASTCSIHRWIPGALSILLGLSACSPTSLDLEVAEIVENLISAGFPADGIEVVDGEVYLQGDATVDLEASREMLQSDPSGDTHEQYRTTNLVASHIRVICLRPEVAVTTVPSAILDPAVNKLSTGLDWAIVNYNNVGSRLSFRRIGASSTGCDAVIRVSVRDDKVAIASFPSGGMPGAGISIGWRWGQTSPDMIEHAITHEIGHTIGLRHSDYYNRSISCGTGGNEGAGYFGVHHISGTPTTAYVGGSLMNACGPDNTNGEFTSSDRDAIRFLYPR